MQVTQQVEFQKFVGLAETKVVAINPTNKELEDLNYKIKEDATEKEYITDKDLEIKDENGEVVETVTVKQAQIDIYVQIINKLGDKLGDGEITKKTFFVTNYPKKSKDQIKYQYISQTGDTSWAADESILPPHFKYFRKKEKDGTFTIKADKLVRPALLGEADLMGLFIKNWLDSSKVNYFDANTNILFDWKTIFKGNFKEIREMIGADFVGTTLESFQIRTNPKDDKQYQAIYKTSFPVKLLKIARTTNLLEEAKKWKTEAYDKVNNPTGRYLLDYEKNVLDMLGEYGSKDFFKLTPLSVYDKEENLQASSEPMGDTSEVDYEL